MSYDELAAIRAQITKVEALAEEWRAALEDPADGMEHFRESEWAQCLRVNLQILRTALAAPAAEGGEQL